MRGTSKVLAFVVCLMLVGCCSMCPKPEPKIIYKDPITIPVPVPCPAPPEVAPADLWLLKLDPDQASVNEILLAVEHDVAEFQRVIAEMRAACQIKGAP